MYTMRNAEERELAEVQHNVAVAQGGMPNECRASSFSLCQPNYRLNSREYHTSPMKESIGLC